MFETSDGIGIAVGCAEEVADLAYHLTVLMQARGFGWDEVAARLSERAR